MTTLQQIRGTVARGWCHEANREKEMDVTLAEAITQEVIKYLQSARPFVPTTTVSSKDANAT